MRRRNAWQERHGEWRGRGRFPHAPPRELWRRWYFHWKLRRRIFAWLAIAIVASALSVNVVFRSLMMQSGPPHSWSHFALPVGVTLLVLWAGAGAIAHRLARPFVELERVARAIGRGDMKARFSLGRHGGGETRVLGETINDMADRIEKQLADQRALLAAVSHEIRTPLARMRLLLEFAKEGAKDEKPLLEIDREIVDIDQLVAELLAASRIDFSALSPRDLDMHDLATQAMERAQVPVDKLVVMPGETHARGDATLVSRAMGNLLGNAKSHGGGVVAVRLGARGGRAFFEVDDDGEGFAQGEEDKAFEAFRKGRSKNGEAHGGAGFGLALVRRIAEAHGGRAYASNRAPKGARVGIEIAR